MCDDDETTSSGERRTNADESSVVDDERNADSIDATTATAAEPVPWRICGNECPKAEIVFLCQVVVLYFVIAVSIYNLTKGQGDSNLWTALLSSCLGYLLPSPSMSGGGRRQRDGGLV